MYGCSLPGVLPQLQCHLLRRCAFVSFSHQPHNSTLHWWQLRLLQVTCDIRRLTLHKDHIINTLRPFSENIPAHDDLHPQATLFAAFDNGRVRSYDLRDLLFAAAAAAAAFPSPHQCPPRKLSLSLPLIRQHDAQVSATLACLSCFSVISVTWIAAYCVGHLRLFCVAGTVCDIGCGSSSSSSTVG